MVVRPAASVILLIFCLSVSIADEKRPKTNAAAEETPETVAKRKAIELVQATVKSDYDKIVDLTYPKVVEQKGGRKKMIAWMEGRFKDLMRRGELGSIRVEEPSPLVAGGSEVYTIVPITLESKVAGGRLTMKSFLLGISGDKGKNWTFVDGSVIGNEEKMKKLLPDLPAELKRKLPKNEKPVYHKDE